MDFHCLPIMGLYIFSNLSSSQHPIPNSGAWHDLTNVLVGTLKLYAMQKVYHRTCNVLNPVWWLCAWKLYVFFKSDAFGAMRVMSGKGRSPLPLRPAPSAAVPPTEAIPGAPLPHSLLLAWLIPRAWSIRK